MVAFPPQSEDVQSGTALASCPLPSATLLSSPLPSLRTHGRDWRLRPKPSQPRPDPTFSHARTLFSSVSALGLYLRPVLAKEGETQKKRMKAKGDGGIIRKRPNGGMCSKKREKEQLVDRADAEKSNYFEPIKRMRKSQHDWGGRAVRIVEALKKRIHLYISVSDNYLSN